MGLGAETPLGSTAVRGRLCRGPSAGEGAVWGLGAGTAPSCTSATLSWQHMALLESPTCSAPQHPTLLHIHSSGVDSKGSQPGQPRAHSLGGAQGPAASLVPAARLHAGQVQPARGPSWALLAAAMLVLVPAEGLGAQLAKGDVSACVLGRLLGQSLCQEVPLRCLQTQPVLLLRPAPCSPIPASQPSSAGKPSWC